MTPNLNLPNLISVARLILVPLAVAAISEDRLDLAFWIFVVAGASDAFDGWIARRWNLGTELGAHLDAIADKSLLVATYVALGIGGDLPRWLVILVVSRDLLIIGAYLLSWILGKPVAVRPLFVSKANTLAQILLAGTVLGDHAFAVDLTAAVAAGIWVVAATTVASGAAYLVGWMRQMAVSPPPTA
ncbi:CDP-alcohol phosphatidyltransferase family protein [Prosthecomicrobium sp. N25]|uniref:CDP-alcohol phosphatidyltransferase family protein n=1 Tax=Prosthecomicrobium sp. N25 TaxID=3129254 RepID=UPI0030789769